MTCCVQARGRSIALRFSTTSRILTYCPCSWTDALELELGHGKRQALKQLAGRLRDVVAIHRGFAVNREARGSFFGGGPSEQVEAQIVAHDACQELGIGPGSEVAVLVG